MTDKKQPEALRLAAWLQEGAWHKMKLGDVEAAGRELRRLHAENETLRTGYAAARLEIESLRGRGWVNLPGQLPEPGKPVLLDIGTEFPIRAMWAAKHTVEAGYDDADWGEYDEAADTYYCPEGWYEWNQNEEKHWAVSETPVAWCALPPPSSAKGAAGDAGTVASCDYKSMFGAAVSTIAAISEALGIDEEEAACANGAELILEAIQRKNEALLAALQKCPVDSQFSPPSSAKGVAL